MHWTAHLHSGPKRVNHAAASVGDRIFTFGGYCTGETHGYTNKQPIDVHLLHIHRLEWREIPKPTEGSEQYNATPFQRYGHTAVAYDKFIYIWGGRNDQTACNRLFCFDTESYIWTTPSTSGTIPCSRDGHSACIIKNNMYVFGGYEEGFESFSQEVYALDLKTMHWTYISTKGESPPFTDFHTGTAIGDRMYIFGGRSDRAAPNTSSEDYYPNDIIYLDTNSTTWVKPMVSGELPVGRRSHSAFFHNGKLYIFGGYNGILKEHYNDLFSFSPLTNTWSRVHTVGTSPVKRRRQVCLVIKDKMYLFGGTSPNPSLRFLGNLIEEEDIDLSDVHLIDHDDLHVLDLSPSLKTLCMLTVMNNDIMDYCMPDDVIDDLQRFKAHNWMLMFESDFK